MGSTYSQGFMAKEWWQSFANTKVESLNFQIRRCTSHQTEIRLAEIRPNSRHCGEEQLGAMPGVNHNDMEYSYCTRPLLTSNLV